MKWWLLAIPQYLIVGVFVGGGCAAGRGERHTTDAPAEASLGLLVLVAGIVLLFARHYPRALFDFVVGINRWVYRVIAYAALMTDVYPPFQLDVGSREPGDAPAAVDAGPEAAPA